MQYILAKNWMERGLHLTDQTQSSCCVYYVEQGKMKKGETDLSYALKTLNGCFFFFKKRMFSIIVTNYSYSSLHHHLGYCLRREIVLQDRKRHKAHTRARVCKQTHTHMLTTFDCIKIWKSLHWKCCYSKTGPRMGKVFWIKYSKEKKD